MGQCHLKLVSDNKKPIALLSPHEERRRKLHALNKTDELLKEYEHLHILMFEVRAITKHLIHHQKKLFDRRSLLKKRKESLELIYPQYSIHIYDLEKGFRALEGKYPTLFEYFAPYLGILKKAIHKRYDCLSSLISIYNHIENELKDIKDSLICLGHLEEMSDEYKSVFLLGFIERTCMTIEDLAPLSLNQSTISDYLQTHDQDLPSDNEIHIKNLLHVVCKRWQNIFPYIKQQEAYFKKSENFLCIPRGFLMDSQQIIYLSIELASAGFGEILTCIYDLDRQSL